MADYEEKISTEDYKKIISLKDQLTFYSGNKVRHTVLYGLYDRGF